MKPDPFFMIVNLPISEPLIEATHMLPANRAPRFMHGSRADAEEECIRLSTLHGGNFVILQAVSYVEWKTDLKADSLPGREEWALRMGLGVRVQVASIQPLDDPDVPF